MSGTSSLPRRRFRWEAFAGAEPGELASLLEDACRRQGVAARTRRAETPGLQRFMLGVGQPETVVAAEGKTSFRIRLVPATADPFLRLWGRVFGTSASDPSTASCVLVQASAADRASWERALAVLADAAARSARPPWEIRHPRFDVSAGLRWRTRRRWQRLAAAAGTGR